jgi:hypothetical protein
MKTVIIGMLMALICTSGALAQQKQGGQQKGRLCTYTECVARSTSGGYSSSEASRWCGRNQMFRCR